MQGAKLVAKNIQRFRSFPPCSSATANIPLYNCCIISDTMKNIFGFSLGMIRKTALFSLQNFSASISVSKHNNCSRSESRKAFSLESTVLITLAIDCSVVFNAAPANHLALWPRAIIP